MTGSNECGKQGDRPLVLSRKDTDFSSAGFTPAASWLMLLDRMPVCAGAGQYASSRRCIPAETARSQSSTCHETSLCCMQTHLGIQVAL